MVTGLDASISDRAATTTGRCSEATAALTSAADAESELGTVMASADILFVSTYYVISVLGILGNGFVIVVFIVARKRFQTKDVDLILNQTVADFFTAVVIFLIQLYPGNANNLPNDAWGEVVCRFWINRYFLWAAYQVSTTNLVGITIERYLKVVYPIKHRKACSRQRTLFGIAIIWIFGFVAYLPSQYLHQFDDGVCRLYVYPNVTASKMFGSWTILIQYLLPVLIFIVCYTWMVISLSKNAKKVAPAISVSRSSDSKTDQSLSKSVRKNMLRTLFLLVVLFILCWTWNEVYFLIFSAGYYVDMSSISYNISVALTTANCCLNPVIYLLSWSKFQEAAKSICCRRTTGMVASPTAINATNVDQY